ncbi:Zinc transport protein ZntB [Shewanella putrefaciens]|uniref:zinc transporter ZntB n=1 Tax=Shewanella putrefaciens TaxID=24 RepID=UPI000E054F11|nr:zinc transporter ZntB [Shewanella putrefaciens]SUI68784.1 Zinc transport protein ZntB [Shewanella putrefaciens]
MHDGFIYSLVLSGAQAGSSLSPEQLDAWDPKDGLLWLHLRYRHKKARHWVINSGLNKVETDALLAQDTRPRAVLAGEGVLLALRGVNLNPNSAPEDMVAIRIYADKQRIISTCDRELQSVKDVAELIKEGVGPTTTGDFIAAICERLTNRKVEFIDKLEEQLSELEEQVVSGNVKDLRTDIAELRRQTVAIRRYLAPQREAFTKMLSDQFTLLNDPERLKLREINDKLIRTIEDLDALRDRANVTQEELLSQQSEQLNKRLYFLSLVSAIFLPLGFLTGLLGVNIGGIPGAEDTWAFATFCGILVSLVALQMALFYRFKWL